MKDQFQVWRCLFPEKGGEHPVALISHPDICARAKVVNVLYCTSQRQGRRPYPNEVMLNAAEQDAVPASSEMIGFEIMV